MAMMQDSRALDPSRLVNLCRVKSWSPLHKALLELQTGSEAERTSSTKALLQVDLGGNRQNVLHKVLARASSSSGYPPSEIIKVIIE